MLRGQYQLFREHAIAISSENEMPQLWILKAQQSYNQVRGLGVRVRVRVRAVDPKGAAELQPGGHLHACTGGG